MLESCVEMITGVSDTVSEALDGQGEQMAGAPYGLAASLITDACGGTQPLRETTSEQVLELGPVADRLVSPSCCAMSTWCWTKGRATKVSAGWPEITAVICMPS